MPAASGTFTEEFCQVIADTLRNAEGSWGNYEAGLSSKKLMPSDTMVSLGELSGGGYTRISLTGTWTIVDAEAQYATFAGWENLSGDDWQRVESLFVSVTVNTVERLAWYLDLGGVVLADGDTLEFPDGLRFELDSA